MAEPKELRAEENWFSTLTNEELAQLVRGGLGNQRQCPNAHFALWHLENRLKTPAR
jgi:hypothetical protein